MGSRNGLVLFIIVVLVIRVTKKSFSQNRGVNLRYNLFSTYPPKAYKWPRLWKTMLRNDSRFFSLPARNLGVRDFNFSYFVGALRREKYYFALLRLKRSVYFTIRRRKLYLRRVPPKHRRFIRQFYLIRAYGRAYKTFRSVLKRPFSSFFISYDDFNSARVRQALLVFQRKKRRLAYSLRQKPSSGVVRPWRFYKLRRVKIHARKTMVHSGVLRTKRFIRISGSNHFVFRYLNFLARWTALLKRVGAKTIDPKLLRMIISDKIKYFSPLSTDFIADFNFYHEVYYVFFKRKKNNFYLTLTNGLGGVLLYNSSGRFLKSRRNKKIRGSLLNLPGLASVFIRRVLRKKISTITKFFRPAGMSKRALKTVYNIFTGAGVVIKNLVKNTRRPHSFFKKTKKIRRL